MNWIIWRLMCFPTLYLTEPRVKAVLQTECWQNTQPYCCREKCRWNSEKVPKTTLSGIFEVQGDNMHSPEHNFDLPAPSNRLGKLKNGTRCKIFRNSSQEYEISCVDDKNNVCCESQCNWDLNMYNATCNMTKSSMICKSNTERNKDLKHLELFIDEVLCPYKVNDQDCGFGEGDQCKIYIGDLGSGMSSACGRSALNRTEPNPSASPCSINSVLCVVSIFIGLVVGICIGYYCIPKLREKWKAQCSSNSHEDNRNEEAREGSIPLAPTT